MEYLEGGGVPGEGRWSTWRMGVAYLGVRWSIGGGGRGEEHLGEGGGVPGGGEWST